MDVFLFLHLSQQPNDLDHLDSLLLPWQVIDVDVHDDCRVVAVEVVVSELTWHWTVFSREFV